jgi:hypothetical protein
VAESQQRGESGFLANNIMTIRLGAVCGVVGMLCYFFSAAGVLEGRPGLMAGFLFGPTFMVSFIALYRYCQENRNRIAPQVALMFGVVATVFLTA